MILSKNYTDLFTIALRNDDIQEFDSYWDGFLLSMTKIPLDDIFEGQYKLRKRESEKLKTVLEFYDLEIQFTRRKVDLIITNWKLWWREVSNKKFETRILEPETEIMRRHAMVKNQGTKQRGQRHSWRLLAVGSQRAVL